MSVVYKSKTLDVGALTPATRIAELRALVSSKCGLSVERIELRIEAVKLVGDRNTLSDLYPDILRKGVTITVKDLGPQFSYRGVFLVEYGGPLVILLASCLLSARALNIFSALSLNNMSAPVGTSAWNAFVQALAIALFALHFVKRELETLFVHKFSRSHMPLSNLFKNSAYYWGFAVAVCYPLTHAEYTAPSKACVLVGVALWVVSQATNFAVHFQLSNSRSGDGDTKRAPPGGLLFSHVCCPNYTAEIAGWIAWSLLTQIASSWLFTLCVRLPRQQTEICAMF
jgi:very-long-chain enoyl-CoA reductase